MFIESKLLDFDKILDRVKSLIKTDSDKEVASAIGMRPNTFHMRKKNNSVPLIEFVMLADSKKVNMNWLIYGEGTMYNDNSIESGNQTQPQLSRSEKQISFSEDEPEKLSKNHGPSSITELITKTIEILESETVYSGALSANIKAFHEATRTEKRLCELQATMESNFKKMDDRMAILEAENNSLRKRLKESPDNGGGMAANQG